MMLSALIWIPLLGAALLAFGLVSLDPKRSRLVALLVTAATLVWTLIIISQFDPTNATMQFPGIDSLAG